MHDSPSRDVSRRLAFPTQPDDQTDALIRKMSDKTRELASAYKLLEKDRGNAGLKDQIAQLEKDLSQIGDKLREESRIQEELLKTEYGIDDDFLEALTAADRPNFGGDYWHSQIQQVPTTHRLEEVAAYSYERLMSLVDHEWLRGQAALQYRQDYGSEPSDCRLHLVGRQRLLPAEASARPQRFAQMLLVCNDFLRGRHDLDLFDGPLLISETASLGVSLDEIQRLGPEAARKLKELSVIPNRDVASTVYELLVGAACVREGREAEMLPASHQQKTPDFRIHDLPVPVVVECKRRLGLSEYAENQARHVERLFAPAAKLFTRYHPCVEVDFHQETSSISDGELAEALRPLCESSDDNVEAKTEWGTIRLSRLPITMACPTTRAFSPVFLREVFGWDHIESQWDGLLCYIDPTFAPVVSQVSAPRCLKWRCDTEKSQLKKARGLTSLWADAVQQIPTGEMGCIYIAYTENMRASIADARTQHVLDTVLKRELYHRALVMVPLTIIDRLYPQALGDGGVEMIESVIPMTLDGCDHMLGDFPTNVFYMKHPH